MRHLYLVAYDVSEDRRLRRVYRAMRGFGDPLQYSVFQCSLSDVERMKMEETLRNILNLTEVRVMIVDIGPAAGRARFAFDFIGRQPEAEPERDAVII